MAVAGRTHEQFLDELRASSEAVERAAAWLIRERRVPVLIQPTYEAATFGERADYADDGDLAILLRVEIKRRSLTFTGKADFPHETIIVDACPNFDKKRPRPFGYLLLNEAMDVGFWVDVERTHRSWKRLDLPDQRNGVRQPFYVCALDLLSEVHL